MIFWGTLFYRFVRGRNTLTVFSAWDITTGPKEINLSRKPVWEYISSVVNGFG